MEYPRQGGSFDESQPIGGFVNGFVQRYIKYRPSVITPKPLSNGGYYGVPPKTTASLRTASLRTALLKRDVPEERIDEIIRIEQAEPIRHTLKEICLMYNVPVKPTKKLPPKKKPIDDVIDLPNVGDVGVKPLSPVRPIIIEVPPDEVNKFIEKINDLAPYVPQREIDNFLSRVKPMNLPIPPPQPIRVKRGRKAKPIGPNEPVKPSRKVKPMAPNEPVALPNIPDLPVPPLLTSLPLPVRAKRGRKAKPIEPSSPAKPSKKVKSMAPDEPVSLPNAPEPKPKPKPSEPLSQKRTRKIKPVESKSEQLPYVPEPDETMKPMKKIIRVRKNVAPVVPIKYSVADYAIKTDNNMTWSCPFDDKVYRGPNARRMFDRHFAEKHKKEHDEVIQNMANVGSKKKKPVEPPQPVGPTKYSIRDYANIKGNKWTCQICGKSFRGPDVSRKFDEHFIESHPEQHAELTKNIERV